MTIREASLNDTSLIRQLARDTWPVSYAKMISPEQIAYMLNRMYDEEALKEQMNNGHRFFIINHNDFPAGFASVSAMDNKADTYRLHKLYVLPVVQGKGLGKALLDHVIGTVAASGAISLELNVNRNNPSVGFYEHEGFKKESTVDIDIGGGFFMNDYIMKKNIPPAC